MENQATKNSPSLEPYLSPLGAWAFALGTSIGWGSLVVTSNSYLLQAGPWGSLFGLLIGAIAMVVVARNYHYLLNLFPDAGGAYTYTKRVFGYDFGFLTAWFLSLAYVAVFWANVTSLPLFAQYFIGDVFKVGYLYSVFGYDVYLGEALLSMAAVVLTVAICVLSRKAVMYAMILMGALLVIGITACFASSASGLTVSAGTTEPHFLPDKNAMTQVMLIACISPWAFIGFENVSHSAGEFAFPHKLTFRILVAAVISATALYAFVIMMSVMAYPPQYDSWLAYISDLGNLNGIEGLPPFYVAYRYLGDFGVSLLMAVLLALVATSLLGNTIALSRLFYSLANDGVLPHRFTGITKWKTPGPAIVLVGAISILIPLLGRTAIGWIVDVTTLSAAIIYGLVSATTMQAARTQGSKLENVTGVIGIVLMSFVGLNLLLPGLLSSSGLEPESYFLFVAWGILGFIFFRVLLSRDKNHRFGRSVAVWTALLALVMVVSFVWINQSIATATNSIKGEIAAYYDATESAANQPQDDEVFVERQLATWEDSAAISLAVAAALITLASIMLLTNFSYMSKWARKSEEELDHTRDIINTDPLTGLPSMVRFHELSKEGAHIIRERGEQPVAVALDLIGMKDYNANHGRAAGDELLRAFANVLRDHFSSTSCSRFAEDHFYALSPERSAAEKIKAVFLDFSVVSEGATLPVRAGAYLCHPEDDIVADGFDKARTACDFDRKTWSSHVTWFSDMMTEEARMRLYVLDHVDEAISERWIRPYYQAVVKSSTGELCSEEALARWIDPQHGPLSPAQFIPILEEAGLLHKVDLHIIDCVLQDFKTKRDLGIAPVPVSVNISLRDLEHLNIASEIVRRVDEAGESHDMLRIEFTESAASDDPEMLRSTVETLRGAGFEVWMDDFGSGYSSLNSLKDFDFDVIKLDMKFIDDANSSKTWDIVSGVVQIAHSIGIRSLAEGIETADQATRLEQAGCEMLQGYLYARPQPLEEAIAQRS